MAATSRASEEAPIAALATAPGPAGIAIVRLSGAGALAVAARIARRPSGRALAAASGGRCLARIVHPASGVRLDDAMVLVFRAPHSYTGEELVELQGHGGRLPARRLLDAVLAAGARLAAPGEFTRRAFLNGRLDLTQAEAVMDLIQARTDRAAQAAAAQLDGALGQRITPLADTLLDLCADLEARLDFEPGELPAELPTDLAATLATVTTGLRALLATWHEGHLLREGALVVISGRPNAGKSSLLNALLGRPRAIVAATPGTTRDSIEESIDLQGIPLRLVDTAGLGDPACAIEAEGVARAGVLMRRADINLHLIDASQPLDDATLAPLAALDPARTLLVLSKGDLPCRLDVEPLAGWRTLTVAAPRGDGLETLRAALADRLGSAAAAPAGADIAARHREELLTAEAQTAAARDLLQMAPPDLVLAAGALRAAATALGRITGRCYSEELLDRIFSRFCVGK